MTAPAQRQPSSEHASSPRAYTLALIALLVLLAVTVGVYEVEAGRFALLIALIVATIKAGIVAFVFMELGHASATARAVAAVALFTVATLVGLSYLDWGDRDRALDRRTAPISIRAREGGP